jgi:hypothetical protein
MRHFLPFLLGLFLIAAVLRMDFFFTICYLFFIRLPSLRQLLEQLFQRRGPEPFNFFRLGATSSREQILFYYLSLVRRAREGGFPRRPAQTPAEYTPTLNQHLPESRADIEALTAAFLEARYSAHPVEKSRVARVHAAWQRLRAALQQRKQQV